jgi:hypothetical protein
MKTSLIAPCGMNCGICEFFQKRWKCSKCGEVLSAHRDFCLQCGEKNKFIRSKKTD